MENLAFDSFLLAANGITLDNGLYADKKEFVKSLWSLGNEAKYSKRTSSQVFFSLDSAYQNNILLKVDVGKMGYTYFPYDFISTSEVRRRFKKDSPRRIVQEIQKVYERFVRLPEPIQKMAVESEAACYCVLKSLQQKGYNVAEDLKSSQLRLGFDYDVHERVHLIDERLVSVIQNLSEEELNSIKDAVDFLNYCRTTAPQQHRLISSRIGVKSFDSLKKQLATLLACDTSAIPPEWDKGTIKKIDFNEVERLYNKKI